MPSSPCVCAPTYTRFSLSHKTDQQPDPPLMIQYQGQRYSLTHSMSIRKSQETVRDADLQQWQGGALPWAFDGVIEASTESVLDLESKEKSISCTVRPRSMSVSHNLTVSQVHSVDCHTDEGWQHFLECCDRLSAPHFSPVTPGGVPHFSAD